MNKLSCPICGNRVQKINLTLTCQCGWSKSDNKKQNIKTQSKIATGIIMIGFSFMGLVVHFSKWGNSSVSIVSLKLSQWNKSLDEKSFSRLRDICKARKKYNCVEKAYEGYFLSSGDISILPQLADFQYRRKKHIEAAKTYKKYFEGDGKNVKAAYNYALILEDQGKTKEALSFYRQALSQKSQDVFQVNIMRSYIDFLVKSGKITLAKKELLKIKPFIEKQSKLIKQEYNRWNKQVNS